MPSGVASAPRWKLSYMSAQPVAVLGDGAEPPPDSTEPIRNCVIWALLIDIRSAWVIWPIFSSSVIRLIRSATRVATGWLGSLYGGVWAAAGAGAYHQTASPAARAVAPTRRCLRGESMLGMAGSFRREN